MMAWAENGERGLQTRSPLSQHWGSEMLDETSKAAHGNVIQSDEPPIQGRGNGDSAKGAGVFRQA